MTFISRMDDMEALIAASALCLLPVNSLFAKMDIPLVLLEALREQVPIVVSDHGPLPELVKQEVGLCVPTSDSAAFADAVLSLLDSPDRWRKMGRAGRELVCSQYAPEPMARRYEEVYDSLDTVARRRKK